MSQYRKLSKWQRRKQKFDNWCSEFADQKMVVAAFLFLASCIAFWVSLIN